MENHDMVWKWKSIVSLSLLRNLLVWKTGYYILQATRGSGKTALQFEKKRASIQLSAQKAEEEMQFELSDIRQYEVH
jgi:hypothetical protein